MLPDRTPWCRQELPRHGCPRQRIADEHRLHGTKSDARPAEQRGAANDKGLDWTLDVGHRVQNDLASGERELPYSHDRIEAVALLPDSFSIARLPAPLTLGI